MKCSVSFMLTVLTVRERERERERKRQIAHNCAVDTHRSFFRSLSRSRFAHFIIVIVVSCQLLYCVYIFLQLFLHLRASLLGRLLKTCFASRSRSSLAAFRFLFCFSLSLARWHFCLLNKSCIYACRWRVVVFYGISSSLLLTPLSLSRSHSF
jgi:hypothetical protein